MLLPLAALVAGGVAVWLAGARLSREADALAEATGVGRVLVGALVLGVATSLPEVAATVTAGVLGNPGLAVGNLFGGVALQTVVLAVADVYESRQRLTFQVSSPAVLVQHVALLLLLALATAGMAVGEPFAVADVGMWPVLLAAVYVLSLAKVRRAQDDGAWEVGGRGPRLGKGAGDGGGDGTPDRDVERPPARRLAALGAVVLVAGWMVARAGDELASSDLLSGTFVGAAIVALTTSLPEISTVVGSLRQGAYDMAVANIVGTNGLEVALLLVADVAFRGGPILDHTGPGDVFLAALASVLTCIYLGGLLLRSERSVLRIGRDSLLVFVVYAGGLVLLATAA